MSEGIYLLHEVLEEEKGLYEQLVEMAKEKQEYIVKNDLDKLNQTIAQEDGLLGQINEQEKKRKDVVEELTGEEKTFSEICRLAPADLTEKLRALRGELLLVLEELGEINSTNGRLIQDSMQINTMTLQALTSAGEDSTYSQEGDKKAPSRTLFDKKA